ncbi:MAG TPA: MBL fold metallo-hydrolase [Planctomycetota bacterium]|jgi:metallo-beta-lactamase family protein
MKIHFHGAVRTVTGSLHIIETSRGEIVLLDCGMFQGRRAEAFQRNTTLPISPSRVKAVVISHAHIDHIGNLPTWAARGLRCPVYATGATVDLCGLMLRDSAHIQVLDAQHVNRKRLKPGEKPAQPLYTPEDAEKAIALLRGRNYREWFEVLPGLRAYFHDAGHILGSAGMILEERNNGTVKRLAFTGDVGRPDSPILRDPEPLETADALLTETTYGDRDHPPQSELPEELRKVMYETISRGGKVIIPAFALGRVQAILYAMRQLQEQNKLPDVPVFVDSPLATGATEIFARHPECYDAEATDVFKHDGGLFVLNGATYVRSAEESKALNDRKGPFVVIAASGMCEAGRILHHLEHGLGDPRNTILIVGFQAEHTLGRRLVEHMPVVRVFGQEQTVRAQIKVLEGFSAHAGQHELLSYLDRSRPQGPVFLVHGDEARTATFKTLLESRGFSDVRVPEPEQEVVL